MSTSHDIFVTFRPSTTFMSIDSSESKKNPTEGFCLLSVTMYNMYIEQSFAGLWSRSRVFLAPWSRLHVRLLPLLDFSKKKVKARKTSRFILLMHLGLGPGISLKTYFFW